MNAAVELQSDFDLMVARAKPVLKWVGGKAQLEKPILKAIERLHPGEIGTYYEPFAGGLAIFFALRRQLKIRSAVLSDTNEELINFYLQVQQAPEALILALRKLKASGSGEKHYYSVRDSRPRSDAARAARFKYINARGYNGLWRVNKKNICNVPWGRHKKPPEILHEDALWCAHHALSIAEIQCAAYTKIFEDELPLRPGFVYLDPPYWPTRPTASFTSYTSEDFGQKDQECLRYQFALLAQAGTSTALLSNSDVPGTRALYADFKKRRVSARRNVNSVGTKRGAVSELLVESSLRK